MLLLGSLVATQSLLRLDEQPSHPQRLIKLGLLVFAVAFPILAALILHPTMYDGMRHFFLSFLLLPVCVDFAWSGFLQSQINRFIKAGAGRINHAINWLDDS